MEMGGERRMTSDKVAIGCMLLITAGILAAFFPNKDMVTAFIGAMAGAGLAYIGIGLGIDEKK